jgi:hypothetical protein
MFCCAHANANPSPDVLPCSQRCHFGTNNHLVEQSRLGREFSVPYEGTETFLVISGPTTISLSNLDSAGNSVSPMRVQRHSSSFRDLTGSQFAARWRDFVPARMRALTDQHARVPIDWTDTHARSRVADGTGAVVSGCAQGKRESSIGYFEWRLVLWNARSQRR